MSIAEKLVLIAENEQKVYDAGYAAGRAEGGSGDSGDSGDSLFRALDPTATLYSLKVNFEKDEV